MTRKMTWPARALGAALALGTLALAGAPTPSQSQETRPRVRVERDACRCVDRDGNPIENCHCFSFPDVERVWTGALADLVSRPRLGVTLASRPEDDTRGATIDDVMEDGPAEEAGIRAGDVITRVGGKSLLEPLGREQERRFDEDGSLPAQRLMALVREIEPGDDVAVEYLRDGERRTVTVKARELSTWAVPVIPGELRGRLEALRSPSGEVRVFGREGDRLLSWGDSGRAPRVLMRAPSPNAAPFIASRDDGVLRTCPSTGERGGAVVWAFGDGCLGGLRTVELNPGLAGYFGTEAGVLVADVHEDSRLGLQPGDVILAVGDREVDSPDRLRRVLGSYAADETVTLRIRRQNREMSVQGTLGRP